METALVKYQFALFTLIMGQSHWDGAAMNQTTRVKTTKKEGFSDTAGKADDQGPFYWYVNERPIYKGQIRLTTKSMGLHVHLWGCMECTKASDLQQSLCHANC